MSSDDAPPHLGFRPHLVLLRKQSLKESGRSMESLPDEDDDDGDDGSQRGAFREHCPPPPGATSFGRDGPIEVVDRLFLGSAATFSRSSEELLEVRGITHAICCASAESCPEPRCPALRQFFRVPLEDSAEQTLQVVIDTTVPLITHILSSDDKSKIVVYCERGVSRSPTVIMIYLMKQRGLSYEAALESVRRAAPGCEPNRHFVEQLRALGDMTSSH